MDNATFKENKLHVFQMQHPNGVLTSWICIYLLSGSDFCALGSYNKRRAAACEGRLQKKWSAVVKSLINFCTCSERDFRIFMNFDADLILSSQNHFHTTRGQISIFPKRCYDFNRFWGWLCLDSPKSKKNRRNSVLSFFLPALRFSYWFNCKKWSNLEENHVQCISF